MNCPRCNQHLAKDTKFCTGCGHSLTLDINSTGGTPGASSPPENRIIEKKYELLDLLGEGGMGAVYRARRLRIGDFVAIKILHQKFVTEASALERFRREAQAAAMLQHPNIVTIYDYGEEPETGVPAFIVMELVTGEPLRKILDRDRQLAYPRAVAILQSACAGIAAGHRRHVVHRDIKPDNIMVCPPDTEGEAERVIVVDFGIAKLRDLASASNLTQTGIVMGTPYYMSPEQCRGEPLEAPSDVYSLGATLYEMLAGRPPFTAATVTGVVAKHLTEPPPPLPAELRIPPPLEAVIQRSLAKDPRARQADAAALARELQAALAGTSPNHFTLPAQAAPPSTVVIGAQPTGGQGYPTQPQHSAVYTQPAAQPFGAVAPQKSKTGLLVSLIGVVVVLVAAGGAAYWFWPDNHNQNRNASYGTTPPSANSNMLLASANSRQGNNAAAPPAAEPTAGGNRNGSALAPANPNNNSAAPPTTPTAPTAPTTDDDSYPPADAAATQAKILAGTRLVRTDVEGLGKPRLRILRNTVYARHGRIFDTAEMRLYFNRQPWYQPRNDYRDSMLTAADRANIELILAAENRR